MINTHDVWNALRRVKFNEYMDMLLEEMEYHSDGRVICHFIRVPTGHAAPYDEHLAAAVRAMPSNAPEPAQRPKFTPEDFWSKNEVDE